MTTSSTNLKPFWHLIAPSWLHLISSWYHFTTSWQQPLLSWHHLTPSWHHMKTFWHHQIPFWHHMTSSWQNLATSWHHLTTSCHNLTPSWKNLIPSWYHLRPSWHNLTSSYLDLWWPFIPVLVVSDCLGSLKQSWQSKTDLTISKCLALLCAVSAFLLYEVWVTLSVTPQSSSDKYQQFRVKFGVVGVIFSSIAEWINTTCPDLSTLS